MRKKNRNKQKIKIPFSECRIPIFERLVHGSWFAYTLNENYKIWLTVRYFHFDFKISVSKICDDVCVACDNQGVIDRKGLEFQTDGMIINNRTENEWYRNGSVLLHLIAKQNCWTETRWRERESCLHPFSPVSHIPSVVIYVICYLCIA